ncbi:hypothetical protein [Gracilimonas mengyeensis]|uniref:Uncharacterized protein n=1 Tax=Gracilimonas mengyeensis TaxID=1302730 RepID=A0A521DNU2_9BACT|nr:hypothetical protein [Gracilimonas mengyeensis]SMO73384.1 hypothetical protein SAMN06265219_10920 [Gracilimonas mengyeensis]
MKTFTNFLFSIVMLLGFSMGVMGQDILLDDDFESGNLNNWTDAASDWEASTTSPLNGTYSLKHALDRVESESTIYTSITASDLSTKVTIWQLNLKNGSWDPSGGNDFSFVLMADESDPSSETLNGYVVGINFSGTDDLLTLWKITGGSASSLITTEFDWGSGDLVGIKVERSSSGDWQLFYDNDGDFDNLTLGGSATDTDHSTFLYSSIFFDYTSTRAGELWIDDILIQQNDETVKGEPADYPSTLSATGSIKSVNLSWTDASSSPTPDGYLIKASDTGFGTITDPADTNPEAEDTDISDGIAALNVLQGAEEVSFSG